MNIYLIGYRGSGKSTLGRMISPLLNFTFMDIDKLIAEQEKRSIPEIFANSGEQYFRKKESEILNRLSGKNRMVVATGGGIILVKENRDLMSKTGYCIYLKADSKTLLSRIQGDKDRPPLTDLPLSREIDHLLSIREPLYEEIARITIDTGILSTEQCINIIIDDFKKRVKRLC
jgi:shikimate kinase